MNVRSVLLAATVLAAPVAVQAQPVTGLYIGAGAGVNFLNNETLKSITGPTGFTQAVGTANNGKIKFAQPGFAGLGSIGWGFGNGLRLEVEGDYMQNKAQKATAFGDAFNAGGSETKYGAMVNAFYDFPVAPWFIPYIGAGVGYMDSWWHNVSIYAPVNGDSIFTHNTQGSFAYQAMAGFAVPVPAVPGLALTAEYRFMGLAGNRNYGGSTATIAATGQSFPVAVNTSGNYNNSILVGVRYNFGVAPPPPPPPMVAPAPAPARSYLVFFDWDKYNLTDRAKQIIADAAANIPKVQHTRIEVNGYTDTSGSAKYNMALSIRRAQTVAAELVRLGVPKDTIAIQGFGQTHLLVPTADGVREPQNRRVEIIIK